MFGGALLTCGLLFQTCLSPLPRDVFTGACRSASPADFHAQSSSRRGCRPEDGEFRWDGFVLVQLIGPARSRNVAGLKIFWFFC